MLMRRAAPGLRRPAAPCAAAASVPRRHSSSSSGGGLVAAALDRRADAAPDAAALLVPHQGICWSYGELRTRARSLAAGLQVAGYAPGDAAMVWLPSVAENVLVQLAAAIGSVRVATVKDADGMAKLEALQCKGIITTLENHLSSGKAAPGSAIIPPIVTDTQQITGDFLRFSELLSLGAGSAGLSTPQGLASDGDAAMQYFYNSAKGTSQAELISAGDAAAAELALSPADSVCLPITLSHSFGFGSGALAVLRSGATLVLPSATPGNSSDTIAAITDHGCTVLYADTHTLKGLLSEEEAAAGGLDLPETFRGGLVKIGSGDAFALADPRSWAGRGLVTVGKPAAAAHAH